ncbi:DJ-1/PfpI family protein [Paenibacillus sp. OSY-SE]|uniref:DJ-1/PfpI family protein n=1 Tax=Paenibacillus sp. OSY-SE TaxID=1196323 RepID=UPI0002D38E6B|nr:DJ-1/PfpI family protein [Paenibacillus sp. OSY-SE]
MKSAILLYPDFSKYEISITLSVLMKSNKEKHFIGLNDTVVMGESGLRCVPDAIIADFDTNQHDSLIIPGCMDFRHMTEAEELFVMIRRFYDQGHLIAAISSALYLLARSGILTGKNYTVGLTREEREFLGVFDETHYEDKKVVQAGNIIPVLLSTSSMFISTALS